jgi:hypothetical protein
MKYLKSTSLAVISLAAISAYEYIEPPPAQSISQSTPISQPKQPTNFEPHLIIGDWSKQISHNYTPPSNPEQLRLFQMEEILRHPTSENVKTYAQLCAQATTRPQIGMTLSQSRQTSWCYPEIRNITLTKNGEFVQEVYKNHKFLYFENDILVAIQE